MPIAWRQGLQGGRSRYRSWPSFGERVAKARPTATRLRNKAQGWRAAPTLGKVEKPITPLPSRLGGMEGGRGEGLRPRSAAVSGCAPEAKKQMKVLTRHKTCIIFMRIKRSKTV